MSGHGLLTNPDSDAALLQTLNCLPRQHDYEITVTSELALRQALESALCNGQEEVIARLFPRESIDEASLGLNRDEPIQGDVFNQVRESIESSSHHHSHDLLAMAENSDTDEAEDDEDYSEDDYDGNVALYGNIDSLDTDGPEYTEAMRGSPCGHIFKSGESIYRCRTCGVDETCVLCAPCFRASDHEGHVTSVSIASGSGGCCDCGDVEAWLTPQICTIHSLEAKSTDDSTTNKKSASPIEPMPEWLRSRMREVAATALDHALDTLCRSLREPKLNSVDEIRKDAMEGLTEEQQVLSTTGSTYSTPLQAEPPDYMLYTVVLWNDEVHSFLDVMQSLTSTIHCSKTVAKRITEKIDSYGRGIVESSRSLSRLEHIATRFQDANLGVSIRSARDLYREEQAGWILNWLIDITSGRRGRFGEIYGSDGISSMKEAVNQAFCGTWSVSWFTNMQEKEFSFGREEAVHALLEEEGDEDDEGDEEDEEKAAGQATEQHQVLADAMLAAINPSSVTRATTSATHTSAQTSRAHTNDYDEAANDNESDSNSEYFEAPLSQEELQAFDSVLRGEGLAAGDANTDMMDRTANVTDSSNDHDDMDVDMAESSSDELKAEREQATQLVRSSTRCRLDYFLLFDIRLWKNARSSLHTLFITTLMHSLGSKMALSAVFARNYMHLADAFLSQDRAPETSVMHFTVQLFTAPTIAVYLAEDHRFLNTIITLLRIHFLPEATSDGDAERSIDAHINCSSPAFTNRRFMHIFQDLRFMLSSPSARRAIGQDPRNLLNYLELLNLFQDMNPQRRAIDRHVEYESDTWINAFQVTMLLARTVQPLAQSYAQNARILAMSLQRVLRHIGVWASEEEDDDDDEEEVDIEVDIDDNDTLVATTTATTATTATITANSNSNNTATEEASQGEDTVMTSGNTASASHRRHKQSLPSPEFHTVELADSPYQVIRYRVSLQGVSFHHPMHWLLAELLRFVHLLDETSLKSTEWHSFRNVIIGLYHYPGYSVDQMVHTTLERLLCIFDYPIRVCSWMAQINSGVWVRNGYTIRNQAHHYRDLTLRDAAYDNDIFLVQTSFILLDPSLVLATLVDRFELTEWLNDPAQTTPDYDASQMIFMVEEMLHLIILCVSELTRAANYTEDQEIERAIWHATVRPVAYSELTRQVLERVSDYPQFDRILQRVCQFHPPDGINDHGRYEIRAEYMCKVDPYYIHYSRNQRAEAEETLKSYYEKQKTDKPVIHLVTPQKIEQGPFKHVGNNPRANTDTLVDESLHLMLLALIDTNNNLADPTQDGFVQHIHSMRRTVALDTATQGDGQETAETVTESLTLLDLLLRLSVNEQFKEHNDKAKAVIDRLVAYEHRNHANWEETRSMEQQAKEKTSTEEQGKGKPDAKALQAKIMQDFAKAQQDFMSRYAHLMDEDEDYEDEDEDATVKDGQQEHENAEDDVSSVDDRKKAANAWQYATGPCMQYYGMLGLVQPSAHVRYTSLLDTDQMVEALYIPNNLSSDLSEWRAEQAESNAQGKSWIGRGKPQERRPGLSVSTCGHFVHMECFESYCASIQQRHQQQPTRNQPEDVSLKEYMCPLCKSLGNLFIPMIGRAERDNLMPAWLSDASLSLLRVSSQRESDTLSSDAAGMSTRDAYTRADLTCKRTNDGTSQSSDRTSDMDTRRHGTTGTTLENLLSDQSVARLGGSIFNHIEGLVRSVYVSMIESGKDSLGHLDANQLGRVLNKDPSAIDFTTIKRSFSLMTEILQITCRGSGVEWFEQIPCDAQLHMADVWADTFGYTVCATEITMRGVVAGESILDTVPETTRNLLRYFSEAMATYVDMLVQDDDNAVKLREHSLARLRQIGIIANDEGETAILHDNTDLILAELSMYAIPKLGLNWQPVLSILYIMEVVKCILVLSEHTNASIRHIGDTILVGTSLATHPNDAKLFTDDTRWKTWSNYLTDNNDVEDIAAIATIANLIDSSKTSSTTTEASGKLSEQQLYKLVRTFILPFLRRSLLLLHTRFNFIPNARAGLSEYEQLREQMGLPSFSEIAQMITNDQSRVGILVRQWCASHQAQSQAALSALVKSLEEASGNESANRRTGDVWVSKQLQRQSTIRLASPVVYELIPLPYKMERLFELVMRRSCKNCRKIPVYPAICLVCGMLVCSQSICCNEGGHGECYMHMKSCSGNVGMFLLLKRCYILLLHRESGCFTLAPYLDVHGEADADLK
ncbi:hypothetical protein BDF22DRAFT_665495 [Syncephalis plumigaleata]|nr:hypothetical protein BDF22DRAFT_665495 [Syncephalis plumigaleata]